MQRRDFLAASAASGALAALPLTAHAQAAADGERQYFEWRTYRLAGPQQQARVHQYLEHAAIPAWRRIGLGPVGAFTLIGPNADASIRVLLAYPSAGLALTARDRLEADAEYKTAAADYLAAQKADPAFLRIDSWLAVAFRSAPQLTAPQSKCTVYEMRTYQSHSEDRARAKIEMFNNGEIPIFVDCGFEPIFFGETLFGANIPHLKYMLAAPDMAANEAGWQKFIAHPDWLAMRDLPEYKDTVSNIQKLYLEPAAYSQV
jgi:hypothetical protein